MSERDIVVELRAIATRGPDALRDADAVTLGAAAGEIERLRAALRKIASGDPSRAYSPIGPLHAAGIVFQWEIDAKIAREALDHV